MRMAFLNWCGIGLCLMLLGAGCGDDSGSSSDDMTGGDGDGDTTTGDGDGDTTTGDGDGDTTTGDGDGDTTGDGDGDMTGDGDGDTTDDDAGAGDGDGDEDAGSGDGDGDSGCSTDAECDDSDDTTFDSCGSGGSCDNRAVYYDSDMQAIFQAKCSPCHTGATCSGGVCFPNDYADTQGSAGAATCSGLDVWECINKRIDEGSMPRMRGCSGDPATDEGDSDCLTAEEHALLDAWIAAGAPESE